MFRALVRCFDLGYLKDDLESALVQRSYDYGSGVTGAPEAITGSFNWLQSLNQS